jgi:hypothetical protein
MNVHICSYIYINMHNVLGVYAKNKVNTSVEAGGNNPARWTWIGNVIHGTVIHYIPLCIIYNMVG